MDDHYLSNIVKFFFKNYYSGDILGADYGLNLAISTCFSSK